MNVSLILEGEFAGYPSKEAQAERAKHIVHRLATVRSTAAAQQEIAKCKHTPGTWQWGDNSITVVDIRERNIYADSQAKTEAGTVYPQYIYATPDEWGNETYYMTEKAMHVNIAYLRTLGDDWADISIDDCTEWPLIEVLRISDDETLAIYACHEGRHPTYCRLHATGNGYFSERGAYRNVDDARSDE